MEAVDFRIRRFAGCPGWLYSNGRQLGCVEDGVVQAAKGFAGRGDSEAYPVGGGLVVRSVNGQGALAGLEIAKGVGFDFSGRQPGNLGVSLPAVPFGLL